MRVALFDTETTDLLPNSVIALKHQPHIIEFYCNVIEFTGNENGEEGWMKRDELEFFAKPPVPLTELIQGITGIKPEDLKDAPPFRVKADQVRKILEGVDMVVAHNLSFDMAIVDAEFQRLEQSIEWPGQKLCTVEATEHLMGYRLKLGDLYEHLFGKKLEGAHRARTDVEGMTECFIELWARGEIG